MLKMQIVLLVLILFPCFALAENDVPAEIRDRLKSEKVLGNNSQGNVFIITIPPNEEADYAAEVAEVYVASIKPTKFKLYRGSDKILEKTYVISQPMGVITIGRSQKVFEVRTEEEVIGTQTIIIESERPVSVYVMNSKGATTDGYMALPVSSWGTEYIHCAYYDNAEPQFGSYFAGGFIIMASEDNTTATINLRGVGGEFDSTSKGHAIGNIWNVNLNYGEYYMVRGNATTDGVFDMTGTLITSNKPIGLISFHERTDMPWNTIWSRDNLCEMIPPVTSWGNSYVTVETDRGAGGKGDIFRICNSEPNTKFTITWYDLKDFNVLGKVSSELKKAGEFFDYTAAPGPLAGTENTSIQGVAIFKADKPIMVNQYSATESWDNASNPCDPFQIVITSVEQYTNATIFQVPANKSFFSNNFNLIVIGDTADPVRHDSLIKSVKIDGEPVYITAPKLLTNRIPGTELYFVKGLEVSIGPHYIIGDTRFGGYIYGRVSVDSYGWPAAMQVRKLDEVDTLAPLYKITGTCGDYEVSFTELRNGKPGDNPKQVESGVVEAPTLLSGSFNFNEFTVPDDFSFWPPNYDSKFFGNVIDKSKDAKAVFAINDREGNIAMDSIMYYADKVEIDPNPVDFAQVRKNTSKTLDFKMSNAGSGPLFIDSVYMQKNKEFKLVTTHQDTTINPVKFVMHQVQYTPTRESMSDTDLDQDSIIVITGCLRFSFPVQGRGVLPKIKVEDFAAGMVVVGESKCNDATGFQNAVRITNTGSADLNIYGYTKEDPSQPFNENTSMTFPYVLTAGQSIKFEKVCFSPTTAGTYSTNVTFHSDAESGDSVSLWSGSSAQPGPMISGKNWGEVRVKTVNPGEIEIWNEGSSAVSLTGLKLEAGADAKGFTQVAPQFTDENNNTVTPSVSNPVLIEPSTATSGIKKVLVKLNYSPDAEYGTTSFNAIPSFAKKDNIADGTVIGVLTGTGILPKIATHDVTFPGVIEVNSTHPDVMSLTIKSTSESSVLFIKELKLTGPAAGDFTITPDINTIKNITLGKKGESNDSLPFTVTFTPKAGGTRTATLEIYNDASEGPSVAPIIMTPAILTGYASTTGADITSIDYGTVARCDEPEMDIVVSNAGSEDLTLNSITVPAAYTDVLVPVNFVAGTVVPGTTTGVPTTYTFKMRFVANERAIGAGAFTASVVVSATQKGATMDLTSTIKGNTSISTFTLSTPKIDGMIPGMKTTSQYKKFPISMELKTGAWATAKVTSIRIEIKRDRKWFKLETIEKGAVPGDWSFNGTETDDLIVITGSGSTPLTGGTSIELCNPVLAILLSEETVLTPTIEKISFNDRDDCVTADKVDGEIKLEACVAELRNVILSGTNYKMATLNPNPVSGNEFNLGYSVGLDNSETHIELVNSVGELVQVVFDGVANTGEYNAKISTANMAAGVYTIKMVSGPYSATQKFVFVK